MSIIFGPIPSRRLGRSLGINNIPPKICSYSCVYCQIGVTDSMSIKRKNYYLLDEVFKEVSENVRNDLMNADWVSVKIDTVDEKLWHKIDRPNGKLDLQKIITGIKTFACAFKGTLVTETMLVKGINDDIESIQKTAEIISQIKPEKSFILVLTRPPAEKFVEPPFEENLNIAYQIFCTLLSDVELLISNEGTNFSYSSNAEKELLSILAVNPMRKDAIETFINKANSKWDLIEKLINKSVLKEVKYSGSTFFVKNIKAKVK